ncbi:MAG: TldD/PmbA family protein [Patescibacteria group bacterium]
MDDILSRARQLGVQAEVFRLASREISVEFENNRLKRAETSDRAGLAVRVISRGRLGFAASSLPADEAGLLDRAVTIAAFGKEIHFPLPGLVGLPQVAVFDEAVTKVTPEELVAYGEDLIEPLRAADPRFKAGVSLTAAEASAELVNTAGFEGRIHKTIFGGSVSGILIEGESFLELAEGNLGCRRTDALKPLRDRILDHLRQGRRNISLASGQYPVLFTPVAHASLLGPFLASLNGKAVEKGASPFRGRLGEEAFARSFTLHDDPLLPFYPATSAHDGEGLPSRRTSLIERGVITDFLLDLDTAAALGLEPNGNSRRGGWAAPPGPGPSTLVVEPGTVSSREQLAGMREGLLVHYLMGAGQGNPYGGVVSANIMLGFLVRGGEIVGRVKNTMLAVDVFELYRSRLAGLSSDSEAVSGGIVLPHVLADGVAITAKEG